MRQPNQHLRMPSASSFGFLAELSMLIDAPKKERQALLNDYAKAASEREAALEGINTDKAAAKADRDAAKADRDKAKTDADNMRAEAQTDAQATRRKAGEDAKKVRERASAAETEAKQTLAAAKTEADRLKREAKADRDAAEMDREAAAKELAAAKTLRENYEDLVDKAKTVQRDIAALAKAS